jgi:hypothetical protein
MKKAKKAEKEKMRDDLAVFGQNVLRILHEEDSWGAEVFDRICLACEHMSCTDGGGYFRARKEYRGLKL